MVATIMETDRSSDVQLLDARTVDRGDLYALLDAWLGPSAARLFTEHGDWWYRGSHGRWVVTCDGEIAGYRATVPTVSMLVGEEIPGVWAMHLYVSPRFRGRGLQRLLDQQVLEISSLRMSFPNRLGAKIYVKQGYGLREDLGVLRLPLRPNSLQRVREATGAYGLAVKTLALGLSPIAAAFRGQAARYKPKRTELADGVGPGELEDVFRRYVDRDFATTRRDKDFLRWRYFEAPYRSELAFYVTGPVDRPTHYAVVRYIANPESPKARVLDVFGDFKDLNGLEDLLRVIARDAILREATFLEMLAGLPQLAHVARRVFMLLREERRFRWLADSHEIHDRFSRIPLHWTIGDGENDYVP